MNREISFYRKSRSWYAYLPEFIAVGGTEAECAMVQGADTLLDLLAGKNARSGKKNKFVTLRISNKMPLSHCIEKFDSDRYGASYVLQEYENETIHHMLWLCPVTLAVFNRYPNRIYFDVLDKGEFFDARYEAVSKLKRLTHILKVSPRYIRWYTRRIFTICFNLR
jgi:hypothetical protein